MRFACLLVVLLLAAVLMGRGLGDENAVWIYADSSHYLLNGAFLTDVVKDHPIGSPMTYAREYFARYPGLTLGHHPVLTPIVEIPFFATLGVSVWSGRLSVLCTLAIMLVVWFRFMERAYDTRTAFVSSLLLASAPSVVAMSHQVESEPLALCFIAVAFFFLQRYCDAQRRWDGIAFVVAVLLSLYGKQLAAVILPVYVFQYARAFGFRRLFSRRPLTAAALIVLGALPLLSLTLNFSRFNVQVVTQVISVQTRVASRGLLTLARAVTVGQVGWVTVVAGLLAAVLAFARRDGRVGLFLFSVASVGAGLIALGVHDQRYGCYSVLALCGLAASLIQAGRTTPGRWITGGVLMIALGYQIFLSAQIRLNGGGGYEEAARFVTDQKLGDSVLYCATEDNGFFVFFVRKHDPQRQMIVLRADKLLTISRMRRSDFARVIQRPEDIAPILKQFGVGYVVIEDRQTPDGPLEWLRQMVHSDQFTLRRQIPIVTSEVLLQGVSLGVYEYKAHTAADPDARLSMSIPLIGDTITVPFRNLLQEAGPAK